MELAVAVGASIGNSVSALRISDDLGDAAASTATARARAHEVDRPHLRSAPGAAVEHELVLFGTVAPF
jgi:hypothetical protein